MTVEERMIEAERQVQQLEKDNREIGTMFNKCHDDMWKAMRERDAAKRETEEQKRKAAYFANKLNQLRQRREDRRIEAMLKGLT